MGIVASTAPFVFAASVGIYCQEVIRRLLSACMHHCSVADFHFGATVLHFGLCERRTIEGSTR